MRHKGLVYQARTELRDGCTDEATAGKIAWELHRAGVNDPSHVTSRQEAAQSAHDPEEFISEDTARDAANKKSNTNKNVKYCEHLRTLTSP